MENIDQLIEGLEKDPNEALDALISIGAPAVESLCRILEQRSNKSSAYAAKALGIIGDKHAVESFLRVVQIDDPHDISLAWINAVQALWCPR